jgi:hypothetical protein
MTTRLRQDRPRPFGSRRHGLMADHPWASGRKALRPALGLGDQARPLARTASASRPMRGLVLIQRLGRMRAAFIDRVSFARMGRHAGEVRRRQDDPRRRDRTMRTIVRLLEFRHRPKFGERAAVVAEVFIDRHRSNPLAPSSRLENENRGEKAPPPASPHRSAESGMSTPPVMHFVGPAALGMMSKSKISVGR